MKYTIGAAIAVGVLASTSTAISAAATHSEGQSPESVAAKESYVVVDSDKATVGDNGAIFYPTGEIESDTLVIIPDGDGTVGGVAVREVVSALDSGGTEALRETFAESAEIEIAGAPDATVQGRVTIALPAFRAGSTSVHFASGTWRF